MQIRRKEALLALLAMVLPWFGRRTQAQVPLRDPSISRLTQSTELVELQRRITALEAQVASQVGFTKDAYGNLKLRGDRTVTVEAGNNISIKSSGPAELLASGATTIRGSTIALN